MHWTCVSQTGLYSTYLPLWQIGEIDGHARFKGESLEVLYFMRTRLTFHPAVDVKICSSFFSLRSTYLRKHAAVSALGA